MALVCVLEKTNNVLRIKEYSFIGVEGMNNFEINIQDKITIESIFNIRCQAGEAFDSKRVVIEK